MYCHDWVSFAHVSDSLLTNISRSFHQVIPHQFAVRQGNHLLDSCSRYVPYYLGGQQWIWFDNLRTCMEKRCIEGFDNHLACSLDLKISWFERNQGSAIYHNPSRSIPKRSLHPRGWPMVGEYYTTCKFLDCMVCFSANPKSKNRLESSTPIWFTMVTSLSEVQRVKVINSPSPWSPSAFIYGKGSCVFSWVGELGICLVRKVWHLTEALEDFQNVAYQRIRYNSTFTVRAYLPNALVCLGR